MLLFPMICLIKSSKHSLSIIAGGKMHQYQMYMSHTKAKITLLQLCVAGFVFLFFGPWTIHSGVLSLWSLKPEMLTSFLLFSPLENSLFSVSFKGPFYTCAITLKLSLLHFFILPPQVVADISFMIFSNPFFAACITIIF